MAVVIVGYDGSDSSTEALQAAFGLAPPSASVNVIHTYTASPAMSLEPFDDLLQIIEDSAGRVLDSAKEIKPERTDLAITYELHVGRPGEVLADLANSRGARLLSVGQRGAGMARFGPGGVAGYLSRHARVPLLIVPPTTDHEVAQSGHDAVYREPLGRATTVDDAMHHGLVRCDPATSLREVAAIMADSHVHCVFVLASSILDDADDWSIVSDLDLAAAASLDLDECTAGEIAVTPRLRIGREDSVERASQMMAENQAAHVVVVDGGVPVGIVSTLDIARAMSSMSGQTSSRAAVGARKR